MRILVVEDEKRLAGTLADLLHRQGYTVTRQPAVCRCPRGWPVWL